MMYTQDWDGYLPPCNPYWRQDLWLYIAPGMDYATHKNDIEVLMCPSSGNRKTTLQYMFNAYYQYNTNWCGHGIYFKKLSRITNPPGKIAWCDGFIGTSAGAPSYADYRSRWSEICRHSGGLNVLWFDAHVTWETEESSKEEGEYGIPPNSPANQWGRRGL